VAVQPLEEASSFERGTGLEPVFLVGPARSGTSLIYKSLCLHPDVAYISNWVARFPDSPRLAFLNRAAPRFSSTRRRAWFGTDSNAYVYGRKRGLGERLFPTPVEGEPVYAACGIGPLDIGDGDTSRQQGSLRRSVEKIQASARARVFVNKRIANNRRIGLLDSAFPGARFVSLVRDGRAVARSLSEVDWWEHCYLPWYGGSPAQWAAEGRDPWEACARNWVEDVRSMDQGLLQVAPARLLRLTYESFIADPQGSLGRIAAFVGLEPRDEWDQALLGLSFPSKNGWREALGPEAVSTITTVQKAELEEYGYDL
jgi:omega-hydroxy-beta-dihydromenaquinone-9 sulfotransferase